MSEDDFRRHLVTLEERTNAVPIDVVQMLAPLVEDDDSEQSSLPLQIEKQVADDLAFIAAVSEGAQSVAAVCLERHVDQNGTALFVRVAGMDVVNESVRNMLDQIVKVLQSVSLCALTGVKIDVNLLTDQLFQLIIQQHRQKLLGRLRSKKWTKPKYLSLTHKKSLWKDFQNVIHRVQHVCPKKSERKVRDEIEEHLRELQQVYEDFESTEVSSQDEHLQSLIKATYTLCRYSCIGEFAAKLDEFGTTVQIAAAVKTLHQLEKIGAYWRIALSFIGTAQKYPVTFRSVKLAYLTPYASIPTNIGYESWAKTCHVHAEVQLVVEYALRRRRMEYELEDTGTRVIWPRTIGTSKYLCYLCHLFLTYHAEYLVLNTHGRLYDQWTVPDLLEYDEDTKTKFEHILEQMDEHVCRQIEEIETPIWRAEPMTSRQNLCSSICED